MSTRDVQGPKSRADALAALGELGNRASRAAENERFDRSRAPYKVRDGEVVEVPPDELWVRADTGVHALADKLISVVLELPYVDLACIGAATVNTAVKAVAVTRERLSHHGLDLWVQPYFSTVEVPPSRDTPGWFEEGEVEERTRLMLRVVRRVI